MAYKPEIINYAQHAPIGAVWQLKHAISWMKAADLEGLSCIKLYDDMPDVTEDTPESIKRNLEAGLLCPGQYLPKKEGRPAAIMLFLKVVYQPIPPLYFLLPRATKRLTVQLAFGVAYHVLATTKSRYADDEEFIENEEDEQFVADYVSDIITKMELRWYYRF